MLGTASAALRGSGETIEPGVLYCTVCTSYLLWGLREGELPGSFALCSYSFISPVIYSEQDQRMDGNEKRKSDNICVTPRVIFPRVNENI